MTPVNVIVARRAMHLLLTSVLRDWMVLGLITPVVLVDADALTGMQIPALVVDSDGVRVRVIEQALSGRAVDVARICIVSWVADELSVVSTDVAQRVVGAVDMSLSQAQVVRAHLFVGSPTDDWQGHITPVFGWHNLVLSPEDSAAPGYAAAPLAASFDDSRWLMSVTGALASLLGLWSGQSESILETRPAPSGAMAAPIRTFSRTLTADAVEEAVEQAIMGFGVRYPTPRIDNHRAVAIADPTAAAVGMADEVLAKHPHVMPRQRTFPPSPSPQNIGFMQALKAFFTFMLDAIRGAPRRIAKQLMDRASAAAASSIQSAVYGTNSGFAVVVRGVRSDGSPASWNEFESGVDGVLLRSSPSGSELGSPFQDPSLWDDYIQAGMTLLDAGSRDDVLRYRTSGTQRAVIVETDKVAPSQDTLFELPAHIAAYLPNWRVEVVDIIGMRRLNSRLDELRAQQPSLSPDIAHEQQRLRGWATATADSYAGHMGRRLDAAYTGLVDEITSIEQKLASLDLDPNEAEAVGAMHDKAGKTVRWLTIGLLVLVVALCVLTGFGIIVWPILVVGVVLGVLFWAGSGASVLLKAQRRLYLYLHGRRAAESELHVAQQHRLEALEDLRRVSRAYRQYLDWTRVLSAFIHAPLGQPTSSSASELQVGEGLPQSNRIGRAVPSREVIEEVSDRWRTKLFDARWLSRHWDEFVADVPPSLGDLRFAIQDDPGILRSDQDLDGQGPTLTRWSRAAAERASTRPASPRFLSELKGMTRDDYQARDQLLARVVAIDPDTGALREWARSEFLAGLDGAGAAPGQTFLDSAFSPAAGGQARIIDNRYSSQQSDGLATATVLVEIGQAGMPSQYRGGSSIVTPVAGPGQPPDDSVWS